jgi:hypothetical protein
MKETCGCCEGINPITPAQIANRPGLPALSYRAGTHATFLETMKARLSNFYLGDADQPKSERAYPLRDLATREPHDPAIALLDAWATVADVLTFYQERIANEGYLRTATERRSVLELARLVGYNLRPGVAASTYLAYTLEKESAVTIPAGSRAQSVPGPDETLQSFETSDDLPARTEWNILQPRLTRPQSPGEPAQVDGNALYFKGVTTNLKPNDAILIDFGTRDDPGFPTFRSPEMFRVIKVEPDNEADRTKVTLQLWWKERPEEAAAITAPVIKGGPLASLVSPAVTMTTKSQTIARAERVREIVTRFSDEEHFGDLLKTRTGEKVAEQLEALRNSLNLSDIALARIIREDVLPKLREVHHAAEEGHFTRLEPWIQELITELESALEVEQTIENVPTGESVSSPSVEHAVKSMTVGLAQSAPSSISTDSSVSVQPVVQKQQKPRTDFDFLIDALEKPPSIPPPHPSHLERDQQQIFSDTSDISPQILTTLRPGLAPLLLTAWENRPVTEPPPVKVYAMRTRASVFAHNAPLKPIVEERTGRVTGQEEWTLVRPGAGEKEDFNLRLTLMQEETTVGQHVSLQTNIMLDRFPQLDDPSGGTTDRRLPTPPFEINYTAADEIISVNVTRDDDDPFPTDMQISSLSEVFPIKFKYVFLKRELELTITFNRSREPTIETSGIDPASVEIRFDQQDDGLKSFLQVTISGMSLSLPPEATEKANIVSLDAPYPQILPTADEGPDAPESWVVLERPEPLKGQRSPLVISRILQVKETSRADYGLSLKTTQLTLKKVWLNPKDESVNPDIIEIDLDSNSFRDIRGTAVFAQSELLELAEAPIDPLAEAICGKEIELDGLYSGLETGRWLIITGERADVTPYSEEPQPAAQSEPEKPPVIEGLKSAELVMLAGVRQDYNEDLKGDKTHSFLLLSGDLAYCYKRDTVTIYGNVAHATHGETRAEVLGSGDASQPLQTFVLKQPPLTHVSAPTVSGTESTLKVRVNDILWHETESLAEHGAKDRRYVTRTDDEGQTRVIFGNGEKGARLPTGIENVTAVYRKGIGQGGNVKAGQISLVATKPLGVKDVINPLPATGGADKEDRDTARRNAPLAVMSLDRLVSVQDYEDFARTFAGIGKASAARLSDGRRQTVFLTIAGADDIPIAETSDLYQNLRLALHKFGDPFQAVQIKKRLLKLLVIVTGVRVHPDYLWEKVELKIRASLLDKFSFARRELGQDVLLSEVVSAIQAVEGVLYVDVDKLGAIDEDDILDNLTGLAKKSLLAHRIKVEMARVDEQETDPDKRIRPAELAILSSMVADTLILKEVKA